MRVGKNSSSSSLDEYEGVVINGFSEIASDESDVWMFVSLKERKEYFAKTADNVKANVPGTFLIKDNGFDRRSNDIGSWIGGGSALIYKTNTNDEGAVTPSSQSFEPAHWPVVTVVTVEVSLPSSSPKLTVEAGVGLAAIRAFSMLTVTTMHAGEIYCFFMISRSCWFY